MGNIVDDDFNFFGFVVERSGDDVDVFVIVGGEGVVGRVEVEGCGGFMFGEGVDRGVEIVVYCGGGGEGYYGEEGGEEFYFEIGWSGCFGVFWEVVVKVGLVNELVVMMRDERMGWRIMSFYILFW